MLIVRYACKMRPPEPGAIPRDGLYRVGTTTGTTPSGHHAWGWVEYSRRLDRAEEDHYDLEYLYCAEVTGLDEE